MVNHFYDEDGRQSYWISNDNLVPRIGELIYPTTFENFNFKQFKLELRDKLYNLGAGVIQGYEISRDMGGLGGGCKTLSEWRSNPDSDPIEQVLKEIMFDFVDQGYLYREFLLVVETVYCSLVMAFYNFDD